MLKLHIEELNIKASNVLDAILYNMLLESNRVNTIGFNQDMRYFLAIITLNKKVVHSNYIITKGARRSNKDKMLINI